MKEQLHLPDRNLTPVGVTEELNFRDVNTGEFVRSGRRQLLLLKALSADLAPVLAVWSDATPPGVRMEAVGVKPVIASHLLAQLGK